MKKYKEYIKRLCALLLVCTLVVSQDLMPVHALTDNTTVTESTENEINATAGENTEATNGGQIEAQTPENSAVEAGNEKGGTLGEEIKENVDQAGNGANLPENNAESTTPSGDDENQVNTAENPAEEGIIQDDRLLPEETTEDEIMPADAGTTENLYPEGSIHVNPSDTEKTDPLGNTVTVKPGNNKTGDGSLAKPYYSLGKAYEGVAVPGEGEPTEKNIYVHSGVIVSGEEAGTDENGTDIVASTGTVKSATYFAEDKKLVVNQADDLDALFTVIGGTLTFQNMTVKMMDEVLAKGAELRIALSGGKAVLGNGLNVPNDNFYFSVNETVGGTKEETPDVAPIQVDQVPNTDGDKIPVVVSGDLVKNYTNYTKSSDEIEKTTTQEWTVKIPIATAANRDDLNNVILKGIGSSGNMVYGKFTTEEKNGEVSAESSETLEVKEWNTPLTFTTEENAVYLTGYHKVESKEIVTETANKYQGMIFVGQRGEYEKGDDANDGLTEKTAVASLNKAKALLDHYDALYKNEYKYPKIIINYYVEITGDQHLDFEGYEATEEAPSETGYRASLWYGKAKNVYYSEKAVIRMFTNGDLYLGRGVKIRDIDIGYNGYDIQNLGNKKPEDVKGSENDSDNFFIKFNIWDANCNITLENMSYDSKYGTLFYMYRCPGKKSISIKDCYITGKKLLYSDSNYSELNLNIEGDTIVECKDNVLEINNPKSFLGISEKIEVKIDLSKSATVDPNEKKPKGKGYLYSEKGGIIRSSCSQGAPTNIYIESGLLAGNGASLIQLNSNEQTLISLYMKDGSKYYQANQEGSIFCADYAVKSNIYYQGGEILSQGKAFLNTISEGGLDYRLILDGGKPESSDHKPLKILAENQWSLPHIYLGSGKTNYYSNVEYKEKIELDLYNTNRTQPFPDTSKIVGKMDVSDDLNRVKPMFKLLYDGNKEIYDGKKLDLSQGGHYLVIGVNGIYIDGSTYNATTGFGGRIYGTTVDDTHADGSMAYPVLTFWDAQRVYNAKSSEERKKLKGIYILNTVRVEDNKKITIAGKGGAESTVKEEETIPEEYSCNFNELPIYASMNRMIWVGGTGTITFDHAIIDGTLIPQIDNQMSQLMSVSGNGTININQSIIKNLNHAALSGALETRNNSTLNIIDSVIEDTYSRKAIRCINKSTCNIKNSKIISSSGNRDRITYSHVAVVHNASNGKLTIENSEIKSDYKSAISCETYAVSEIKDSFVESVEDDYAIYISDEYSTWETEPGVLIISGPKTKIKGKSGIYANASDIYQPATKWKLKIQDMAELEATKSAINITLNNKKTILDVDISGVKVISGSLSFIGNLEKKDDNRVKLNAAPGDSIELKNGIRVINTPLELGRNVKIDSTSGGGIGIGSNSKIQLIEELSEDETYFVHVAESEFGRTLVDCSSIESKASENQVHFILGDSTLRKTQELQIDLPPSSDGKSCYLAIEDENKLWITGGKAIFWDPYSGSDQNAEKQFGGHLPNLAVKSVNGIRSVLLKDGILEFNKSTNSLIVTESFTEPIDVHALSTMSYSKDDAENCVDNTYYGDDFENGYRISTEDNTADLYNWVMPKPNGQKYLINIIRRSGINFSLSSNSPQTLRIENIKFKDIYNGGASCVKLNNNINLIMNNCYMDCSQCNVSNEIDASDYDLSKVIMIKNAKGTSSVSNTEINGKFDFGILYEQNTEETLLLDQVKILSFTTRNAVLKKGTAGTCVIRGENTVLDGCAVSGGNVIAEAGTIRTHYFRSYSREVYQPAMIVDSGGKYYQRGTTCIECAEGASGLYGTTGLSLYTNGVAYLEGGKIQGSDKDKGVDNQGIIELSGTEITGCGTGIYHDGGELKIISGKIAENKYGIVINSYNRNGRIDLSGGTICHNDIAGILENKTAGNSQCKITMSGGKICNNGAVNTNGSGGIVGCKDFTMTDGSIFQNKGKKGAGIANCVGDVRISGGVIENNESAEKGGGIYQKEGTVIVEGGIIRNNHAKDGSAVYVENTATLELNGGEIYGNQNTNKNTGEIYHKETQNLKLGKKGTSYPKIKDTIYLANKDGKIELTAAVRGEYNVRVNENEKDATSFAKGKTVIVPNNSSVQSAASYLTRFTLLSDSYVLARNGKNLVLDGILFVNGTTDTNGDGALPNHPRNDFKTVIEDANYKDNVIYITGAVHIRSGENVVVNDRTIRRYTGQPLNGQKYDANIYNEPLFIVDKGATLTLINCTVSGRMGAKSDETYSQDTGYLIENYGTLNIDVDSSGSGIAADVEKQTHSVLADNLTGGLGIAQHGTLNISPFSQIDQIVKLGGKDVEDTAVYYGICAYSHSLTQQKSCTDATDRFINIYGDTAGTGLQKKLNLDVDNKVDGRLVTTYTALDKSASLQTEKTQHQIKDLKASGLYLTSRIPSTVTRAAAATQTVDMILKRPGIYYVDGTKGNDANKGTCPDEALKTLEKAYEKLADDAANPDITSRGGIIYIVANVDLTGTITIKEDGDASVMTAGANTYNTQGDVIIRRYSKPTTGKDGYTTGTNTGTMFTIADAVNVSIQGVTIDGHSQKLDSTDDTLAAEGVADADAIFSVKGNLTLGSGEAVTKNTLVQNNDASGKNGGLIRVELAGNLYLTGDMPKEADPEEGQAAVYGTRLSGGKAAKGNAVYADLGGTTEMKLAHGAKADYPEIDGSIYLTGNKTTVTTEDDKYSSFVTIADGTAGAITDNRYEFEVQDAYDGRLVVSYPTGTTLTAVDVKGYTVNGRQGYDVAVNDAAKSQIILKALGAVYIDGVSGVDTNDGTAPKKSVKTLKRAYELLKTKKGGVLYVVNTVTITDAQELTETSYKNYGTTVALTEGTVQIQRYGKPTAYDTSAWIEPSTMDNFNVESNANALFSISGSGVLDLKNIQIDGHKDAVALTDSLAYKTNAGAIEATAPLIQVDGGKLNLGEGAVLQNNKNTTAPGSTTSTTGNVPGGAVYNSGTMNITGGVVKGNECKGTARSYTTSEATETVTVTPDASGIWQAGKMNVNVSDTAKLTWDVDQYIYLAEQSYDSNVTEQAGKDAKVSFLNVQALPTDQVLPLDLNRDGVSTGSGSTGSAAGWFAPGRKVVEMSTEGMVTADNFKVNGDSYVGSWLEGTGTLTEKLILAERQDTATILELQRGAKDCIVDVIVPIEAEANSTNEINNLSKKDITVSGAVNASGEGIGMTIPARQKKSVTINGTLSDENRIKISCSDGK